MLKSIPKNKKTSGDFDDLHINNSKENGRKIGIDNLHLVSRNFSRSDQHFIRLKKQN